MTNNTDPNVETIRQMLKDWNAASPEQRAIATRDAAYAARVLELEFVEGLTTSDAQGVADVEFGLILPGVETLPYVDQKAAR